MIKLKRLGAVDLRQRLAALGVPPHEPVAVAVSGGPDSLALALLAREAGLELTAYVVDHGMRAGSADEGKAVCCQLEALKIPARLLQVIRTPASMAQARDARYSAIFAAIGAQPLLVGHHRDDQIETLALRLEQSSGLRGLAGMSARRGQLIRPLLDQPKQALLEYLDVRDVPHLSDPSNENLRFRRPFMRSTLKTDPVLAAQLWQMSLVYGRWRRWCEQQAIACLRVEPHSTGLRLAISSLPMDWAVRVEVLRRVVQAVSGRFDCGLDPCRVEKPTAFGCVFRARRGWLEVTLDPRCDKPTGESALDRLDLSVFSIVSA